MATAVEDNNGVYFVPALSGLGAQHWDMNRKAALVGLTFRANKNHAVRAAHESIPNQVKEVIAAMQVDTGILLEQLMTDGGITGNDFIVPFLADLLEKPVVNIGIPDVSALGAAYLAGLRQGVYKDLAHPAQLHPQKKIIKPATNDKIKSWYKTWQMIVRAKEPGTD